jgi:hypothetical protein
MHNKLWPGTKKTELSFGPWADQPPARHQRTTMMSEKAPTKYSSTIDANHQAKAHINAPLNPLLRPLAIVHAWCHCPCAIELEQGWIDQVRTPKQGGAVSFCDEPDSSGLPTWRYLYTMNLNSINRLELAARYYCLVCRSWIRFRGIHIAETRKEACWICRQYCPWRMWASRSSGPRSGIRWGTRKQTLIALTITLSPTWNWNNTLWPLVHN